MPTTPNPLPSLAAHQPTSRSPLTLATQNSNSNYASQNADNSNMSFTHNDHNDDDDTSMTSDEPSCSSPARTHPSNNNTSQTGNNLSHSGKSGPAHHAEVLQKVCELGNPETEAEPRRDFVVKMQQIWEEYNIQCRNLPTINKVVLDLYKLYMLVKEKGGYSECSKQKAWKDVSTALDTGVTAAAALIIKKKYVSVGVFHFECKYDLNGADPLPIIVEMEKVKEAKDSKKSSSKGVSNGSGSTANTSICEASNASMPGTPGTPSNLSSNGPSSALTGSAKKSKKGKDKSGSKEGATAISASTTPVAVGQPQQQQQQQQAASVVAPGSIPVQQQHQAHPMTGQSGMPPSGQGYYQGMAPNQQYPGGYMQGQQQYAPMHYGQQQQQQQQQHRPGYPPYQMNPQFSQQQNQMMYQQHQQRMFNSSDPNAFNQQQYR